MPEQDQDRAILDLAAVTRADDLAGGYGRVHEGGTAFVSARLVGGQDYRAVIGYHAVREAAADPARLASGGGVTIPPMKQPVPAIPVELDPPEHRKFRRLLVPPLRPERVDGWSGVIRREADRALDEFTEKGEADLTAVARHVPPAVIATVLGEPGDGPLMAEMSGRINAAAASGDPVARTAANQDFMAYLDRIVSAAEGSDRDDLLGTIANAVVDGEPIGHDRAVATALTVVFAGQETTVNGIASLLALLGSLPDVRRQLIADPRLIPVAVEETLRLEAPVQMMGRTAAADTEIEGCPVRAGERIGLGWGAANTDPAAFDHPGEFRLDRGPNPPLTFGHGIHRCVGEFLARAEMIITTEQVLARIPDFELTGPVTHGANTPMNRGVRTIPVRFPAAPRVLS